jgi:flagellar biosynthesis anti-sigma factor FlgM
MISSHELASALRAYVREAGAPVRAAQRPQVGPSGGGEPGSGTSPVSLSPQAGEVGRWVAQLRSLSEVRPERVAEINQRLQSGQYPPSGAEVADKMLGRWLIDR